MIETGSHANPLAITPYAAGEPLATRLDFKTIEQAASFAQQQLSLGNRVDIGMMQIPSIWLDKINKRGVTLTDLLRPCKNLAVGSDLLNEAAAYCAHQVNTAGERDACALSFYKTSDIHAGAAYATSIESYAKTHPIASNPINLPIDFDAWQDDPQQQLPRPTFGLADSPTTASADVDSTSDTGTASDSDTTGDPA